jgi:hypothetical protein
VHRIPRQAREHPLIHIGDDKAARLLVEIDFGGELAVREGGAGQLSRSADGSEGEIEMECGLTRCGRECGCRRLAVEREEGGVSRRWREQKLEALRELTGVLLALAFLTLLLLALSSSQLALCLLRVRSLALASQRLSLLRMLLFVGAILSLLVVQGGALSLEYRLSACCR